MASGLSSASYSLSKISPAMTTKSGFCSFIFCTIRWICGVPILYPMCKSATKAILNCFIFFTFLLIVTSYFVVCITLALIAPKILSEEIITIQMVPAITKTFFERIYSSGIFLLFFTTSLVASAINTVKITYNNTPNQ